MSDYSSQSEGLGAKGLIVAVVLIALFVIGLVFMGGGESGPANPATTGDAAAPAAVEETAPAAATE